MRKFMTPAILLSGLMGLAAVNPVCAADALGPVKITLPEENARFKPGPGLEVAQVQCMICHSADYIYMQPPLSKDQWQAEVTKMKKVFGAPIPDSDIDTVVTYLLSQNGKK